MAIALTLTVQLVGSWSPPAASAADPTPADATPAPLESPATTPDPVPTLVPTPIPTDPTPPDPTVDPGTTPAPTLAPDPSAVPGPSPDPTPDPGPLPSGDPGAGASADPSAMPSPSPTPTPIPWELSNGQQDGATAKDPVPLWRLRTTVTGASDLAVHTGSGLSGPDCAACHSAHRAESSYLLNAPAPRSTLCLSCHSGSGSPYDVASQLSGKPANDPTTDSYYRHVFESGSRQATCTDCHNPHDANSSRPAMSTSGWTASGDIRGADGVGVTNGAAGTAPAYTAISRSIGGGSLALEYQLCLGCHSGNTTLPAADASHPSWWALDKGIELNPANASYHPVEAKGRNQSAQMALSLAGTSPFKAWNFDVDSTIRCASCHGDPSTVDQTATAGPLTPDAAAQEATHASPNRGLLIAPYRDRALKPAGQAYDPNDFGLCYLCHAEAPFVDPNKNSTVPSTAFTFHGFHLTNIPSRSGGGTSIDQPGEGEGLAICAECHFRIHSTAIAYKPGDIEPIARATGFAGLVNFSPNVTGPASTGPVWRQPGADGIGSCLLTCHGVIHTTSSVYSYDSPPGTGFTSNVTTTAAGSAVQFADVTRYISATDATWAWDFGDGSTSTSQNPSHVYAGSGSFTVSLTVTRTADGLSATMTKVGYITVTP